MTHSITHRIAAGLRMMPDPGLMLRDIRQAADLPGDFRTS